VHDRLMSVCISWVILYVTMLSEKLVTLAAKDGGFLLSNF